MRIIGNAGKAREVQAVASGALSTGDTVVVNSDGTVSVVAGSAGGFGSPVVYNNTNQPGNIVFDSNSNKIVIAYPNISNSNYGTAVVGTVSGTSISFGTPVVFESANTIGDFSLTFDSNSNKVIIAYRDGGNSNYGTAVVGDVSGTSISFGSPVVFLSGAIAFLMSAIFDSNSNKVVIAYNDQGNSYYGKAIVGTVSGTSISFGSPVTFESAEVSGSLSAIFDSNSNKVVIVYSDNGNSGYGTAIVGTVSGTSISFGSPVVFDSNSVLYLGVTFDSSSNKVVIVSRSASVSFNGYAIVGTVSGTSISFGSLVVYNSNTTPRAAACYDSLNNKVIISYANGGNPGVGTVILGTVSGTSITFDTPEIFNSANTTDIKNAFDSNTGKTVTIYSNGDEPNYAESIVYGLASTNLTSDNYIGTAATGAPDGQGAKINIKGAVDESQSGLTAGQSYYVQTDGTLGTTPADPSVFAGTAVAANKLIVKG